MDNNKYRLLAFQILLFIFIISSNILFGQSLVTGSVLDAETKEPLIGANVMSKEDNTLGTVTDFEGKFSIEVNDVTKTLVISYTGYSDKEITLGDQTEYVVELVSGELLEDVVIIGYGTVKKEDVTGSLATVSSADFNKGAITGPQQLLAGKIAGVAITNNGDPGGGATIRIRGESSLRGSNDPLIVIDGVPLDNEQISGERNNLNIINPNDIESMTVLKDASATAIYGNRASAGVILITTKKGSLGKKISVGYNANYSVGKITDYVDVLTANEFRKTVSSYYATDSSRIKILGNSNTDWQKEIYQDATGTDHNINFSGAIGNLPYRLSGGYTNMSGLLKTDNFKRYTASMNLNPKFMDNRLQLNLGAKYMRSNNHFADRGAIGSALSYDPTQSPYDSTSAKYGGYTAWLDGFGTPRGLSTANPIALINQVNDESTVNRYIINGTIDYRFKFLPELRANLNLANDYSDGSGTKFIDTTAAFNVMGTNNSYQQVKENSLIEFYLNYKKAFNKHTLDLMTGYSWQRFGLRSNADNGPIIGFRDTIQPNDASELFMLSLFGRANYDFNNILYATFTLRADGTSRFAPENRWGLFPAAAVSAKLIDNNNKTFNSLKARLGWGLTGQQDIGNNYYAYLGAYESNIGGAYYTFGDSLINTVRPNGYDEAIQWETTSTYNLGVDVSLVKDRFSASIDLYNRLTENLLVENVPLAAGTNLTNVLNTNIGEMKNRGIEFSLNLTPIMSKSFTWDLNINVAVNKNEISRLRSNNNDTSFVGVLVGGISGGVGSNIQLLAVGEQPYSFYVYKQKYDENGQVLENQFEDLNKDKKINTADQYLYHSRQPQVTFGFSSNMTWKNLDFSFAGRSNVGNYMYNNVETDMGWLNRIGNNSGTLTNVHQAAVDYNIVSQGSVIFSDHYVRPATFLRIDHITLGYNLSSLIKKNIRLFATVQNAIVITNYTGLDPEQFSGIDNNIYPRPRNFVFGLSANF